MAGRKQRNNVDYFPHYVKASRTKGILKSKFGHEGYSVWYQLLEILSATENHFYDCSDEIVYEYLLAEIGTSDETFKSIIEFLVRVGKIDSDLWNQDRVIWCQKLVDNLAYVYDKRVSNVPQKPALKEKKKPKPPISGPEMANSGSEMQRREVKGIKEKKSALKEMSDFPQNGKSNDALRRQYSTSFENCWNTLPGKMKSGKKAAYRHWKSLPGGEADKQKLFDEAMSRYRGSERFRKGYLKNGSTFFNELEDWAGYEEPAGENGAPLKPGQITEEDLLKSLGRL